MIPKTNGKLRPLTIASPRDKIVQQVIMLILSPIFEPTFNQNSHGFRPKRSYHTALAQVSKDFNMITWIIEGDIKSCFDSFDHHVLMRAIESRISDTKFLNLIWKALRAGYGERGKVIEANIIGTPQGSIISPLFCNIYLNSFDNYISNLKANFDKGEGPKRNKAYRALAHQTAKARIKGEDPKVIKKCALRQRYLPSYDMMDPDYRRLMYVRYADDWIIGVRGPKVEAEGILELCRYFLDKELKLELSLAQTKLTHFTNERVLFLGTDIFRSKVKVFSHIARKINTVNSHKIKVIRARMRNLMRMEVPIDRIRKRLTQNGFFVKGTPTPKWLWLPLNKDQIIHLYNSVFRGYLNYYYFTHNYGRLASFLRWVTWTSLSKLLAAKFSTTRRKLVAKYGRDLKGNSKAGLFVPNYKINPLVFKRGKSVDLNIPLNSPSKSLANLYNFSCSSCGSSHRVEMHHVKHMKN